MNDLTMKTRIGDTGVFIPMIGENDLFVPWAVVKRTEEVMVESRKLINKMPWGVRHLMKKAMKKVPTRMSAINTIIETACAVKQMGGRIVWKEMEYEQFNKIKEPNKVDKET